MSLNKHIITIFLFTLVISCKNKTQRELLTQKQLEYFRAEFNLPKEKTFRLDTSYLRYLFSIDTSTYADEIKNHYQPIQALYYNKEGNLISFHINCYASPGIIDNDNMNWNQANAFASFVPTSVVPLDNIISLSKHLSFVKTFENKTLDTTGFFSFDYTVIIHWNYKWRPKDSKNLIRLVSKNAELERNKKINILYVNNDDTF